MNDERIRERIRELLRREAEAGGIADSESPSTRLDPLGFHGGSSPDDAEDG